MEDWDELATVLSADGGSLSTKAEPGVREGAEAEAMGKMALGVESTVRETVGGTRFRAAAGAGGVFFLSTIMASQKLSVGRRGQPGRAPGSWNKWSIVFALREGKHMVLRDSFRLASFRFKKCFTGFTTFSLFSFSFQ